MRLVTVALGAAALAACGGGGGGGGRPPCPEGETCLNVAVTSAPNTLDPPKAFMALESDLMHNLFVGLTSWDGRARTVPGMATSWTTSPDGLTWTFNLREATWSDGVPVTADDFVFTYRRALDPKTAAPYVTPLAVIAGGDAIVAGKSSPSTLGVFAPDPRTVVFRLERPAANFADILAYMSALPVPRHAVEKWGDAWIRPENFVGNGAYTLASWDADGTTVMRENRRYFEPGRRCFSEVKNVVTTDYITAERRVASGEMDVADRFRGNRTAYLRKALPGYVRAAPMAAPYWISFNLELPKLRDVRVRRAMAMAIDREFITAKLLKAGQIPLYSYTPPNLPGYRAPSLSWTSWSQDRRVAAAEALMRQAGYSREKPLRLELSISSSMDRTLPALLQADWRQIGVEITFAPQEPAIYYADMRIRKFELGITSWITDFIEPGTFLELLTRGEDANYSGYDNPEFDALIERANRQPDAKQRLAMMREAEAMVLRDLPVAPMWVHSEQYLVNPRITGFHNNAIGTHRYEFLCQK